MTRVTVEIRESKEDGSLTIKSFAQTNITSTGKEVEQAKAYIDRFDQLMKKESSARVVKNVNAKNN